MPEPITIRWWHVILTLAIWFTAFIIIYYAHPFMESSLFCEKYGCSKGDGKVMTSQELQQYIYEQNQISSTP